jgi:uncharacterized membrane protein YbaN (DUF454 family)|tara:strand:+ start:27589 stop:28206 length:618 start_codon:yes stop_codon:yes gene_type:complete
LRDLPQGIWLRFGLVAHRDSVKIENLSVSGPIQILDHMIRNSQPQDDLSSESDQTGNTFDRIAMEEIHPEFLDTLDQTTVPTVTGVKKIIFLILAALFFALGVLGVALPVLPTTPFLLLTSYFLIRTSPRLNAALLRSPVLGQVLKEWQQDGGVRLSVKIQAISIVVLVIAATLLLSPLSILVKSVLVMLACIGIVVVIRLPGLS